MTAFSSQQYLGRLVDRKYFVTRILGAGGFGTVYLAEQRLFDRVLRRVALKLFHESLVGPENAHEVFNDAITLILLQQDPDHPRHASDLITVHDAGFLYERPDQAFMVMEYVEGYRTPNGRLLTTLRDMMRAYRPVPEELALRWMIQVCRPVAWMHSLDTPVLHCDLKPENVLASGQNRLKVADFGFARLTVDSLGVAPAGGTLGYIPPELLLGHPPMPSSDVYMLGVILYELLCGENPLAPSTVASSPSAGPNSTGGEGGRPDDDLRTRILERQQQGLVIPPSAVSPEHHDLLQQVVDRSTAFLGSRRYRDASELLHDLRAIACEEGPVRIGGRDDRRPARIAYLLSQARAAADADHAITVCDEVLGLDPRTVEAHVIKARALQAGGSGHDALAVCQRGCRETGDDPRLLYVMAEIFDGFGQHRVAQQYRSRAGRTGPRAPEDTR